MSLKQFHVFFIICSIICTLFFSYWSFTMNHLLSGITAAIVALALGIYEIFFIKKLCTQK